MARNFAKRPDSNLDLEWRIAPDRIATKSAGSNSEFEWHFISRVVHAPKGFLFYPNPTLFYWLPVHGFQKPDDVALLDELVKAKVKDYRDVR